MSDFTRRTVNAAPQLTIQNNSAAHTGAERDANDCGVTARSPLPHLTDRCRIRIVLQIRPPFQFAFQRSCQPNSLACCSHSFAAFTSARTISFGLSVCGVLTLI